jgi:hypothetical protein
MKLPTGVTSTENHAGQGNAAHRAGLAMFSVVARNGAGGWPA